MADQPVQTQQPAQSAPSTPPSPAAPQPPATPPAPSAPASNTEQDERFFAALGYFGFLFVVPFIVKPKSEFCKFHAKQSMVLFLVTILILVVLASVPWFGSLLTLALFAVYVLAIYKAYKGERWNIPLVSAWAGKVDVNKLYDKAGLAVSGVSNLKDKAQDLAGQAGQTVKSLGNQEEAKNQQPPAESQNPPASPPAQPTA